MTDRDLDRREKKKLRDMKPDVEDRLLERHLNEMDKTVVSRIERNSSSNISKARLERARKEPIRFLHHPEYKEHLRDMHIEPKENTQLVGDNSDGKISVDRDEKGTMRTVAHERLHQLSDPLYRNMFGKGIDEGTTECMSKRVAGDVHLVNEGKSYHQETRLVEMLAARVGSRPIETAYFRGDWGCLRACVNRELGEGAMAEIVKLTNQEKYQEAEDIIKKGL